MIGGLADKAGFEKLIAEAMDPEKVVLTCGIHNYSYNAKATWDVKHLPNFKCPKCLMVSFMGLLANTAPEKREETVEMLEYTIHKLIEADKRGEIKRDMLYKHPRVSITKE